MKLVVAVVRPDRVSARCSRSCSRPEVQGLTISRVQGHGGEREHVETYRGTTVKMELSEKVRLEIGVSNHFVEPTVQAILRGARTGEVGDGKIFVLPVEKVVPHPHRRGGRVRRHAGANGEITALCWLRVAGCGLKGPRRQPATFYCVVISAEDAASPSPAAVTVTVPADPFTDRTITSAMP